MESDSLYYILALVLLLLMSAYFSASETAFTSMNLIRIKSLAKDEGNKRAQRAYKLSKDFDKLLSAILIGNNIVNILSTSLATVIFVKWLGNLGVTVSTIVMTVLVVIFGEVSPKSMAKESPEKFAMFSAPILRFFIVLFTPIIFVLIKIKELMSKLIRSDEDKMTITENEILTFVEAAEQEGGINEQESELIRSAVEFGDTTAGEIATPRVDIAAIESTADKDEIIKAFIESGYSRLPVYEDSLDNIIGIIHQKDFFSHVFSGDVTLEKVMKKPVFVTKYMKLQDLMKLLQTTKEHIAVVADEYGGVAGIVTFEDVLEELVGEIWDEHDDIVEDIIDLGDGSFRINGNIDFDKLAEEFDFEGEHDDDEFTSVSGWVMDELEKIPEENDSFEYNGYSVRVDKTDERRVLEIVMTKLPEAVAEE